MHVLIQVLVRIGTLLIGIFALAKLSEIMLKKDKAKQNEIPSKDEIRDAFRAKEWTVVK